MSTGPLSYRRYEWVSDESGMKVDLNSFICRDIVLLSLIESVDEVGEVREVLASIAFSSQVDSTLLVLRVLVHEKSQEVNKLFSSIVHPVKIVVSIGESCAHWLINEDDVSNISPGSIR